MSSHMTRWKTALIPVSLDSWWGCCGSLALDTIHPSTSCGHCQYTDPRTRPGTPSLWKRPWQLCQGAPGGEHCGLSPMDRPCCPCQQCQWDSPVPASTLRTSQVVSCPPGNGHCQGRLLTKCWLNLWMSCGNPPANTSPAELPVTSVFHPPWALGTAMSEHSRLPCQPPAQHSRASVPLHCRPAPTRWLLSAPQASGSYFWMPPWDLGYHLFCTVIGWGSSSILRYKVLPIWK